MSTKLIGRFYFRTTQHGNLIGEFSNNLMSHVSTESADKTDCIQGITGSYQTSWQESSNAYLYDLRISVKEQTNARIYALEWIKDGKTHFWGEGFLADDNMLVGDYRNFNVREIE